jgi:transposase
LKGHFLMSSKELRRKTVMDEVVGGRRKLRSAAEVLQISYRQCRRVYQRYRQQGDQGLIHRNRGRESNRKIGVEQRGRILARYQQRYAGYGPTFASEKLAAEGLGLDHETLRRWLLEEGLWQRQRRRGPHRQRRERRKRFGELVQMDGSHHAWWGEQPRCLMNMVDDATGRRFGLLFEQETTEAAMRTLWGWIGRYGVPQALYVDSKTVFRTDREPTLEEQLKGEKPLTAFGQACRKLGIELIYAGSPQAKGRVERSHGTDQDRLIKELELEAIEDLRAANRFLQQRYWKQINQKFAVDPADPQDQHRRAPAATTLAEIFSWEQTRIVQPDGTLSYENRCFQVLTDNPIRPRLRAQVVVRRRLDGRLEILYRDHKLRFREIAKPSRPTPVLKTRLPARSTKPRPAHPWRRFRLPGSPTLGKQPKAGPAP